MIRSINEHGIEFNDEILFIYSIRINLELAFNFYECNSYSFIFSNFLNEFKRWTIMSKGFNKFYSIDWNSIEVEWNEIIMAMK